MDFICGPFLGLKVAIGGGCEGVLVNYAPEPPFPILLAKPVAKKALESGIKNTGERLGKKISEKSGDLIMKKLAKARATPTMKTTTPKEEESTDMILNRLISGNGVKRRRKIM